MRSVYIFAAKLIGGNALLNQPGPYVGTEDVRRLEFAWFIPVQLSLINVRPPSIARLLREQDFSFRHVVERDERDQTTLSLRG